MTSCTCANRGICLSCQLTELKLEAALTDPFLTSADRGLRLIDGALTERPDPSPSADPAGRSVNADGNVLYLPERRGWSVKA